MPVPKIKIIEKKLAHKKALGEAIWRAGKEDHVVYIDPRQPERERLDTLIHELLHLICPEWEEHKVNTTANRLTDHLWRQGYRRVKLR